MNATPASRNEVIELAKIFRASVVDVSGDTLTMAITGDPGKAVLLTPTFTLPYCIVFKPPPP